MEQLLLCGIRLSLIIDFGGKFADYVAIKCLKPSKKRCRIELQRQYQKRFTPVWFSCAVSHRLVPAMHLIAKV